MSSQIYSETVPFVIRCVWCGDDFHISENNAPKVVVELRKALRSDTAFDFNGWFCNSSEDYGDWKELVVFILKKGDLIVYEINESQYASGGGVCQTFFTESRQALEEFIKDCCGDIPNIIIEEQVSVHQVL